MDYTKSKLVLRLKKQGKERMRNYTAYKDEITRLKTHRNELIERYKTALLRHNRRESRRLWELRQRVEHALTLKQIQQGKVDYPSIAA